MRSALYTLEVYSPGRGWRMVEAVETLTEARAMSECDYYRDIHKKTRVRKWRPSK